MSVTWRAGVAIEGVTGTTPLQVTDADAAAQAERPAAGQLRLVAPFSIAESIDDQLWPAQPRGWGRFSLLANSAAELSQIIRGRQVQLGFKTDSSPVDVDDEESPGTWDIRLPGIIDSAKVRPWWSGGVVGEFTVVDYRVGLLGTDDTGTADWPSEDHTTRVGRILGAFTTDWVGVSPTPSVDPNMVARPASRTTKLEALETTLREWADTVGGVVIGRPVCMAGLIASGTYALDLTGLSSYFRRWELARQERETDPDSTTQIETVDSGAAVLGEVELSAGLLEFDATSWAHNPTAQPTKVSATWDNAGTQTTNTSANADHVPGGPTVAFETQLMANVAANRMITMYLPDAGLTRWIADSFVYRLSRSATDNPPVVRVGQVVAVTDIEVDDNPDSATVYAGRVTTGELVIEGGEVVQTITLRPSLSSVITILDGLDAPTTSWALDLDAGDASTTSWTSTYDGGTAA